LKRGELPVTPQPDDGVVLCGKDQQGRNAGGFLEIRSVQVHNHVRGLAPSPGAWFELDTGGRSERVKLLATELA
jgi:methionyl-tRNA formyltransferase